MPRGYARAPNTGRTASYDEQVEVHVEPLG